MRHFIPSDSSGMVFFPIQEIVELGIREIREIRTFAEQSPTRRARICLHKTNSDYLHEMIVALCYDSVIKPHRHLNKSESFYVLEGELLITIYSNDGEISRTIQLGPPDQAISSFCRLPRNCWHSTRSLSGCSVFLETTEGPFSPNATEISPWTS